MHNPESILEYETHKQKRSCQKVNFAVLANHWVKLKESKKKKISI